MKKNFLILILSVFVIFSACKKDEVNQTVKENPYEQLGEQHNLVLTDFINCAKKKSFNKSEFNLDEFLIETKEFVLNSNNNSSLYDPQELCTGMDAFITFYKGYCKFKYDNKKSENSTTIIEMVVDSFQMTANQQRYFIEIDSIVKNPDLQITLDQLNQLEQKSYNELNSNEIDLVLSIISIAKNSSSYWYYNYNEWVSVYGQNLKNTCVDWNEFAGADVAGGIVGGLAGGNVIGGACLGSIGDGVLQLWKLWAK